MIRTHTVKAVTNVLEPWLGPRLQKTTCCLLRGYPKIDSFLACFSWGLELQTPSFGDPKVCSWTTFWQSLGRIGGHLRAFFEETRIF